MNLTIRRIASTLLGYINKSLPKFNRVIIQGYPNTESSAISVANYVSKHYDLPVYYVIHNKEDDDPKELLSDKIITIDYLWKKRHSLNYLLKYMTSRYIFFTHGSILNFFSDRQTVTNIWHGVLYKKVGLLNGSPPILADITVGTSQSTKKMFSRAFGVSEDSVYITGYPRNDMLLEAKKNKEPLKKKIDHLHSFSKVAIWMPTYRKSVKGRGREDGVEIGNPFYIKDFNISYFNELLKKNNTLCLVKPHPYAPAYENGQRLSNIRFIDSEWITRQGVTLYQLLGCTDLLISDVSSVIIDYMLMDNPIICMSTDFEEYRQTRGFYFDDIENWIPSEIISDQETFFDYVQNTLKDGADPSKQKRETLKNYFFDDQDADGTQKIVDYAMNYKS